MEFVAFIGALIWILLTTLNGAILADSLTGLWMNMEDERLLTIRELSQYLNIKEKTIYDWISLKKIPYTKLNGTLRFKMNHIEKWISDCTKEPDTNYNIRTKLEARKGGQKS